MPIYEYKCTHCGHRFEKIQSFNASSKCRCPRCGHPAKRLISQAAFVLKGTGWYVTDHPSKARRDAQRQETSASSDVQSESTAASIKNTSDAASGGSSEKT